MFPNFEKAESNINYSFHINHLKIDFPGRAVRYLPAPPQTRTSGFPAYGSSYYGFAKR